jgi:hypothetical protein
MTEPFAGVNARPFDQYIWIRVSRSPAFQHASRSASVSGSGCCDWPGMVRYRQAHVTPEATREAGSVRIPLVSQPREPVGGVQSEGMGYDRGRLGVTIACAICFA